MDLRRLLAPLLALTLLGAACGDRPAPAPPRPTGPEIYVAMREGALVRFELTGTTAGPVTELLPDKEAQWYAPWQGGAGRAVVARYTEGGSESITNSVGVVDATTGEVVSGLGPDGPVAGLLLSSDGRYRYEFRSPAGAVVTSVDRVATGSGARRTLVAESRTPYETIAIGGALSPDDETLYVVLYSDSTDRSRLVAIDTGSGRTRTVPRVPETVFGVVVSRDGRTLALSIGDPDRAPDSETDPPRTRVMLLPVQGGEPRWVDTPDATAAAFTRSGHVLLVLGPKKALALVDPATGAVTPVTGAEGVEQPVSVD